MLFHQSTSLVTILLQVQVLSELKKRCFIVVLVVVVLLPITKTNLHCGNNYYALSMSVQPIKQPIVIPPISVPVWSLSTSTKLLQLEQIQKDNNDKNKLLLPKNSMNILTFCTPVSVPSPKLYCISLYYDTLTKDSFMSNGYGILQLLRPCHKVLVPILGKQSGYHITPPTDDKCGQCKTLGYPWVSVCIDEKSANDNNSMNIVSDEENENIEVDVIPNCAIYLQVKVCSSIPAGDHVMVLCEFVQIYQWDEQRNTIIPSSKIDNNNQGLDPTTVLYTGQLREEGII